MRTIRFTDPAPRRRVAMFWRPSSSSAGFLPTLAAAFRELPAGLVHAVDPAA